MAEEEPFLSKLQQQGYLQDEVLLPEVPTGVLHTEKEGFA
jgi:ADP-dependent phosphofructokinase/glucokinase